MKPREESVDHTRIGRDMNMLVTTNLNISESGEALTLLAA
jgi:hypothetical protein